MQMMEKKDYKKIEKIKQIENSEYVSIKTSIVYSKIALMGRKPGKSKERMILIDALENSCIKINVNGRTIKKDPYCIRMNTDDVRKCFGKNYKKYLRTEVLC